MIRWIQLSDYNNPMGLTVHEVKCPKCGHKETYHKEPPCSCYCCGALNYVKEDTP